MKKIYNLPFCLLFSVILFCGNAAIAQSEVTFYTTEGDFVVEMYDTLQPITAGNILKLVGEEFYDGVIFHRVIDNFVVQGGDPTGTGSGGPGYAIDDEFHPSLSNVQKTLSMANSGPNTGGSQFFINLVDNTFLDYDKAPLTSKHPVFGIVKTGFNIVENIGKVSVDGNDRPIVDVVMDSVRITTLFVGINDENKRISSINIYPNPVNANTRLTFFANESEQIRISVLDEMGRLIYEGGIGVNTGANSIELGQLADLDKLSKGIYFMKLDGKNFSYSKKLIFLN